MIFNDALMSAVSKLDQRLYCKVIGILNAVADRVRSIPCTHHHVYNCHSICRAVALMVPELLVVDGHYAGFMCNAERLNENGELPVSLCTCDHSWLVTPDQGVIDPYPVGFITPNPVLIGANGRYAPFGRNMYYMDRQVTSKVINRTVIRKATVLYRLMKEAYKGD